MDTRADSEQRERIGGVFSSQDMKKVGTGATSRKVIQKTFWFCRELDDGRMEIQPLNSNYVPSGPKKVLAREHFLAHYSPEPELYVTNVYPKMRELGKTIARADRHRTNREYYSAEMEYGKVIKVDEENVRANFGLGITYLDRGDTAKADNIFDRLVKLEAAFEQEHKHLFNEFGIKLRKNGKIEQAVAYYSRALELSSHDEHLRHNLARAYLEEHNIDKALEHLLASLEINPLLDVSVKFLLWMAKKNMVPEKHRHAVAAMLKKIKQARLNAGTAAHAGAPEEAEESGSVPQTGNSGETGKGA